MSTIDADDAGSMWRAKKEASKAKRGENKARSTQHLKDAGIVFESKAFGDHLIINHAGHVVDFWPTTGVYIPRHTQKRGRGVFNLIQWLERQVRLQSVANGGPHGKA